MAKTFHNLTTHSRPTHQLTSSERNALPSSTFGLPGQGSGANGKGSGSYPMPDAAHARLAEEMAGKYASPAQRAEVDAKARQVLGE